ncbi:hypothetical protein PILCRDRAFT_10069 [Piloderma croceum F 1598]|uniref:Exportin-2 C-terminal domain-containing protein n=1 Tax=Piloderma croceum (strain F 1598) TaxID=765440 RepID=A0A0C3F5C4_PILCF|nr:hypothetical protein PILCRDRAFT_10069 [Piloderma croceum F 1598]
MSSDAFPGTEMHVYRSVSGTPTTLPMFKWALLGPFTIIIRRKIEQYIPYLSETHAQMLELHTTYIPTSYRSLLPFLLQT